MMLGRLGFGMGVWACLLGGLAQAGEVVPHGEVVPPATVVLPPPPPPAFATRPRAPALVPPDGGCQACGYSPSPGPCWRRLLRWVTYRPLPTQCRGGYFCSSCGGGFACGCRQPLPCCPPHLHWFFLDRCRHCEPPIGLGPGRPPVIPAPGDPPPGVGPKEMLPAP